MFKNNITLLSYSLISIFLSATLISTDYLYLLEKGTIEQKIQAMNHLGYSGNKKAFWYYVKYLSFAPTEEDSPRTIECRQAAAEALGRMQDDRAVTYLIKRWNEEKVNSVKEKIMFALKYYKTEQIPPIIQEGLTHEDKGIQFQSLITAAEYKDESLSSNISEVFSSSENPTVKTAASYALIMLNTEDERPKQYLAVALESESPWQRYWAAHFIALARLTDLIPNLEKSLEVENNDWVRKESEQSVVILRNEKKRQRRLIKYNKYETMLN